MKVWLLQVLVASLVLASLAQITCADKSFPSRPALSHVVRVGRNGRQVVHRGQGRQQGGRRVVRRQRQRQERQFVPESNKV